MVASLRSMMGHYAPTRVTDGQALDRRQAAIEQPYNQAIADAGARATSAALGAGQSSGNPFLARREANAGAARAQAPLLAQRAAARGQMAQQQIQLEEQRRQANQQRMDRFLAAGLSAASMGLGGLLNIQGGSTPGGMNTTPGAPGGGITTYRQSFDAMQNEQNRGYAGFPGGSMIEDGRAAGGENPYAPGGRRGAPPALPLAAPGPMAPPPQRLPGPPMSAAPAQPMGAAGARPGTLAAAPAIAGAAPINPDGSPAMPYGYPQQMAQPQQGGFGQTLGQLAPLASMFPGYGTAIGAGLGGLSALFRG
jgi:hypothetical protein